MENSSSLNSPGLSPSSNSVGMEEEEELASDDIPSSSPLVDVEWYEGFRLPLGQDGRQVLLRKLREVYHTNSQDWDARLAHRDILFSRMPYATVCDLYKVAHLFGIFKFALHCSARYGGDPGSTRGPKKRRKSDATSAITMTELKKELDAKTFQNIMRSAPEPLQRVVNEGIISSTMSSSSLLLKNDDIQKESEIGGQEIPPILCLPFSSSGKYPANRKDRGRPRAGLSMRNGGGARLVQKNHTPTTQNGTSSILPDLSSALGCFPKYKPERFQDGKTDAPLSPAPLLRLPLLTSPSQHHDDEPNPPYYHFSSNYGTDNQLDLLAFQYTLTSQYLQILQLLSYPNHQQCSAPYYNSMY